jgi:hypothetical protein
MTYRVSFGALELDSIQRAPRRARFLPRSGVGISFSASAVADVKKLETQAKAEIGGAANAYANAQVQLDSAMATGKGVEAAVNQLDMTGRSHMRPSL